MARKPPLRTPSVHAWAQIVRQVQDHADKCVYPSLWYRDACMQRARDAVARIYLLGVRDPKEMLKTALAEFTAHTRKQRYAPRPNRR